MERQERDTRAEKRPGVRLSLRQALYLSGAVVLIVLFALGYWGVKSTKKITKKDVISTAQLQKAVNISTLSTAEFVYNGIAVKYKKDNPEKVDCYIAYNANVKVGIDMKQIQFKIDEKAKTITPILPKISVNVASLDQNGFSYIPANPDISLKDVIDICKADVLEEAEHTPKLYAVAKDNLRSVVEALLRPLLDSSGYTLHWAAPGQEGA